MNAVGVTLPSGIHPAVQEANDGRAGNALSVTEAARRLRIKVHTLYRWIYREKIPAFKLNGQWRLNLKIVEPLQSER